ncbi:MAG: alpha/beta hydrolase [Armatimonadota bacterium]|nr:alpha/beta hydrolase [Armatimonadota bacterium]
MTGGKVWYIPGWAGPRGGDCELVRKLKAVSPVEVIWLPEYGSSEWTEAGPCSAIYGPALGRRIENEPEPVAIVGWSMGAMAAIELAAAQPRKVLSLVLLSATARFCSGESRPFGPSPEEVEAMKTDPGADTIRRFLISCYYPARPRADELRAKIAAAMEATPEQLRLGLTYLLYADLRGVLRNVRAPVLLAHGERDAIVPLAAGEELARVLPNARLRVLADAGHVLPETNAEEIMGLIRPPGD